MGLFGNLFEKKSCDVCGAEIGLLGNRKLDDGNLCKECANKLSPFFSDRRASTVEQIKEQLAYREANRAEVERFNVTRTLGCDTKVLLDEDAEKFIVSRSSRWRSENPDVMTYDQVTGCDIEVRENRTEIRRELPDGKRESYDPPRYDVDYNIYLTIHVNAPYFDDISFRVNSSTIEEQFSAEYNEAKRQADDIREACCFLSRPVCSRAGALGGFAHRPLLHLSDARGHADDNPGTDQPTAVVHLGDEMPEHGLGHFKIGDDAILHGPDGHDIARRAAQHAFGLAAHGQNLVVPPVVPLHGHHGGLTQHDAPAPDIDTGIGRPQIDGQIV